MLNRKNEIDIPVVESIINISDHEVSAIRSTGFCYIKILEKDQFFNHITNLKEKALSFFRSSTEEKKTFTFIKNSGKKIDKILISGYMDRRSRSEYLETFRQSMNDALLPPFIETSEALGELKKILVKEIAVDLSKKIFNSLKADEQISSNYSLALENPAAILTFTYYPMMSCFKRLIAPPGINAHRDICLLTVLLIEKPGLEAWMDGRWIPLLPKNGYALVILGDDFTTLTKGQVRSCLHTVRSTSGEERLSIVFFVSMDRSLPFMLTDGTLLAKTGSEYLDKRYEEYNVKIGQLSRSAFSYLAYKINFGYVIASCFFFAKELNNNNGLLRNFSNNQKLLLWTFGLSSINAFLKIFSVTYFRRMILDFLQYAEEPNFATKDKLIAYNLGKKSLSISGLANSFFNFKTYEYRSYWNAGFLSVFSDKFADKKLFENISHTKK